MVSNKKEYELLLKQSAMVGKIEYKNIKFNLIKFNKGR